MQGHISIIKAPPYHDGAFAMLDRTGRYEKHAVFPVENRMSFVYDEATECACRIHQKECDPMYTLNELATMTGLTTRTLRTYLILFSH